jgi:hypothetical protein
MVVMFFLGGGLSPLAYYSEKMAVERTAWFQTEALVLMFIY